MRNIKRYFIYLTRKINFLFSCSASQIDIKEDDLIYKIYDNTFEKLDVNEIIIQHVKSSGIFVYEVNNDLGLSPGLYRITNPINSYNFQFFVKSGSVYQDVKNLMYMFSRGNSDDKAKYMEIQKILQNRRAILTCGYVSKFMKMFFEEHYKNVRIRLVSYLTKEKFNYYNDGHTILEYYSDMFSKWVAVDFTRSCMYYGDNIPLSAYELLTRKGFTYKEYNSFKVDVNFHDLEFNYSFFEDFSYAKEYFYDYTKRIFGSIIMISDGYVFTISVKEEEKKNIKEIYPNMIFMEDNSFIEKFYGDQC